LGIASVDFEGARSKGLADSLDEWPDFRGLAGALDDYEGTLAYRDVLVPWLEGDGVRAIRWLGDFGERAGRVIAPVTRDELEAFYALSRANEALLANFQPARPGGSWRDGPAVIAAHEYAAFMTALGLEIFTAKGFSPFYHEIVTIEQDADIRAPIVVAGACWPAVMLGDMLISRAGVAVSGGSNHIRKEIAETSSLYWASRRRNRPRTDLSTGWGSNSQWGTAFRRDYRIGDMFYFNVDGKNDLRAPPAGEDRDGLTPEERSELLIHRCFITVDKPHNDLWPYDDTYRSVAGMT
jgi:hypothetical protein